MKKILLSLFAISGLFLISGCSLTGTTVDDNPDLLEQMSLLQQQMSGLNSEVQELKEQNKELIEENETIKISLSDQNSGASILLAQNEELKKDVEKYKQVLVQERLKNKQTNEDETTNIPSTNTLIYNNSIYWFNIEFIESREWYISKTEWNKISFWFTQQESLFTITALSKSEWNNIKNDAMRPTYLWENNNYVFVYITAQDAINQNIANRMWEINNIITTFQIN